MKVVPSRRLFLALAVFIVDTETFNGLSSLGNYYTTSPSALRDHQRVTPQTSQLDVQIQSSEVIWLMDEDGNCMNPFGFGECGDATMWRLHR